jgi:hypothetical protein
MRIVCASNRQLDRRVNPRSDRNTGYWKVDRSGRVRLDEFPESHSSTANRCARLTDCLAGGMLKHMTARVRASMYIAVGQRFLFMLCCCGVALAQNPELGRVERSGNQATLVVERPRPVDLAASTLASEFGIRVNVEDPVYIFRDDVKDVTANVSRDARIPRPVLVPKGGALEIHFTLGSDGMPMDIHEVLRNLVDVANAQFPFQYRLDAEGDWFTIIPTHTRDQLGNSIATVPLLDRRVTISPGTRPILESASLMADALSTQTGLRVSCCQAGIAGIPWGLASIFFEAKDEPARSVLKRLFTAAAINQPARDYWLQRCDPLPSTWCFINLAHISRETASHSSGQPTLPFPVNAQPSPFFVRAPRQ